MSKILKYVLAVNYMILAALFYFNRNNQAFLDFPVWARTLFPVLLFAYGFFRLYRAMNTEKFEE